jgi:hypothetical protein
VVVISFAITQIYKKFVFTDLNTFLGQLLLYLPHLLFEPLHLLFEANAFTLLFLLNGYIFNSYGIIGVLPVIEFLLVILGQFGYFREFPLPDIFWLMVMSTLLFSGL